MIQPFGSRFTGTLFSGNLNPGADNNGQTIGTSTLRWTTLFSPGVNAGASTLTLTALNHVVSSGTLGINGSTGNVFGLDFSGNTIRLETGAGAAIALRDSGSGNLFFIGGNSAATAINSQVTDGATAIGLIVNSQNTLANAGSRLLQLQNNITEAVSVDRNGELTWRTNQYLNNSGTPGNTTISRVTGRAAIANAASACVVTNTLVAATTIIFVQCETTGVGVADLVVTPGAGSFTVTSVNATGAATVTTGALTFSFIIFNS